MSFGGEGGGGEGGAFGLGMDDGGDDGDDVFAGGGKGGYDVEMCDEEEDDEEAMMERARQPAQKKDKKKVRTQGDLPLPEVAGTARTRCNDGRVPLKGYILGYDRTLVERKAFPPPVVPHEFSPFHRFTEEMTVPDFKSPAMLPSNLEACSKDDLLRLAQV